MTTQCSCSEYTVLIEVVQMDTPNQHISHLIWKIIPIPQIQMLASCTFLCLFTCLQLDLEQGIEVIHWMFEKEFLLAWFPMYGASKKSTNYPYSNQSIFYLGKTRRVITLLVILPALTILKLGVLHCQRNKNITMRRGRYFIYLKC